MKSAELNKINTIAPASREELMNYAFSEQKMLIAVNAEKILNAPKVLVDIINQNIGYPDGFGAVWALQKKGIPEAMKIPGCELWLDIIKKYNDTKHFYFIGGTEEVIQEVIEKLKNDFPKIKISGYRNGYIKKEERSDLLSTISSLKPEVVFVAMGSPKQELLMQEMQKINPAVYMGLGGSYDLYIGKTRRAPEWWMKIFKWEGLYRSLSDITNLDRWKRQSIVFKFMWKVWMRKF